MSLDKDARHNRRQADMNGKENRQLKQTIGDINNGVIKMHNLEDKK